MEEEHWFKSYWRPACAYGYLIICLHDFCLAPIWLAIYSLWTGTTLPVWTPLTLQGAGTFHMSFGAILGVSAWTRGQEKVKTAETVSVEKTTITTSTPPLEKK